MHNKFVVLLEKGRPSAVWTGSTNWTDDAFSREENAIVRVSSPDVAASYTRNFEQLWAKGRLESSGGEGPSVTLGRGVDVRPFFSPRGPSLAHVTAERIEVQDRADRAIFAGNVHVTQAEMTLDAPRLTVAYSGSQGTADNGFSTSETATITVE